MVDEQQTLSPAPRWIEGARRLFLVASIVWWVGAAALIAILILPDLPSMPNPDEALPGCSSAYYAVEGVRPNPDDRLGNIADATYRQCIQAARLSGPVRDRAERETSPSSEPGTDAFAVEGMFEALGVTRESKVRDIIDAQAAPVCRAQSLAACNAERNAAGLWRDTAPQYRDNLRIWLLARLVDALVIIGAPLAAAVVLGGALRIGLWVYAGFKNQQSHNYRPPWGILISRALLLTSVGLSALSASFAGGVYALKRDDWPNYTISVSAAEDLTSPAFQPSSVPLTGLLMRLDEQPNVAPLTIKTALGANTYVKIVRADTGRLFATGFIRAGETFRTNMPLGNFRVRYAYGKLWNGPLELFGTETRYAEAQKTFEFRQDGSGFQGYEVELVVQPNGNLTTRSIAKGDF